MQSQCWAIRNVKYRLSSLPERDETSPPPSPSPSLPIPLPPLSELAPHSTIWTSGTGRLSTATKSDEMWLYSQATSNEKQKAFCSKNPQHIVWFISHVRNSKSRTCYDNNNNYYFYFGQRELKLLGFGVILMRLTLHCQQDGQVLPLLYQQRPRLLLSAAVTPCQAQMRSTSGWIRVIRFKHSWNVFRSRVISVSSR